MKRFATILGLVAALVAPPAEAQQLYGWTISSSQASPSVNSAPLPTFNVLSLYLWLDCAFPDGCAAAEFDITVPAGSSFLAFTAQNGWLNAGLAPALLLATPCTNGPLLAGAILVLDTGAGDYCIVPSAANGKNVSVDCTAFQEWGNATQGFNNQGGTAGCTDPQPWCVFVGVEDSSWGAVKSLYR